MLSGENFRWDYQIELNQVLIGKTFVIEEFK